MKPYPFLRLFSQLSFSALLFTLSQITLLPAQGQDQSGSGQGSRLSFLSSDERSELMRARKTILANNPDLKAEQEDLRKQAQALKSGDGSANPDDKKALMQNFLAHEKKMKAAMLQVDPNLAPVFDKIDAAMKQKMQDRAGQNGNN